MRHQRLPLLLAASLLRVSCSSAPAPAPPASSAASQADGPAASPAEAGAKLSGFWLVSVARGGQSLDHSLHIQLTEGLLVGSLSGADGNSHEVSKIALKGDKVSWEVAGERMAQRFEGTLKGSSMEGKIKMVRSSRSGSKGQGKGGGQSGDDGGGDTSASPPAEGQTPSSGSGGGGRGGRGGRGRGGRAGTTPDATWKAFKSVEPPAETTPVPVKTEASPGQVLASNLNPPSRREGFPAGTVEAESWEGLPAAPPVS